MTGYERAGLRAVAAYETPAQRGDSDRVGRLSGGVLLRRRCRASRMTPAFRCVGSKWLACLLFRPDDWLFSHWFGAPPQFALADRLPVLLAGRGDPGVGRRLGLDGLLTACRARRRLTRLETFVFATGVGLNAPEHLDAGCGLVWTTRPNAARRRPGASDLRSRGRPLVLAANARAAIAGRP